MGEYDRHAQRIERTSRLLSMGIVNRRKRSVTQPDPGWFQGEPLVELRGIDFSYREYDTGDEVGGGARNGR
jgi:hypothetical protein